MLPLSILNRPSSHPNERVISTGDGMDPDSPKPTCSVTEISKNSETSLVASFDMVLSNRRWSDCADFQAGLRLSCSQPPEDGAIIIEFHDIKMLYTTLFIEELSPFVLQIYNSVSRDIRSLRRMEPSRVAQCIPWLTTDACLTVYPGVASSIPYFRGDWPLNNFYGHSHPFRWFKKDCCQLQAKVCALSTG